MTKQPVLISNFMYDLKNKKSIYLHKFKKKYFIILKINYIFKKLLPISIYKLFNILNINKGIIIIETLNYSCKIQILKKQSILLSTLKYNISINIFYIKIKINFNFIKDNNLKNIK
ncbi:MAG: hypothetical protein ACH6QL_00210 [Candidatus Makana argininalis]